MAIKIGIQFGWNTQTSSYQNLKSQRARIARFAGQSQNASSSVGSALSAAVNNQINGDNIIAGQRAYTRVQTELKAVLAKKAAGG